MEVAAGEVLTIAVSLTRRRDTVGRLDDDAMSRFYAVQYSKCEI